MKQKNNFDYVFLFGDNNINDLKHLYNVFDGCLNSFKSFKKLLDN